MPRVPLDQIAAHIGQEVGVSSWILIDQARIDAFANATEDRQFIHVDPERASQTPFGGTIAHGFLTLALLSCMRNEAALIPETMKIAVNYGLDRVRFITPVRAGSRVRGHFRLEALEERAPGQMMIRHLETIEIEGEDRLALSAVSIGLMYI